MKLIELNKFPGIGSQPLGLVEGGVEGLLGSWHLVANLNANLIVGKEKEQASSNQYVHAKYMIFP